MSNSNTISLYVNPFMATGTFLVLTSLHYDTHQYIGEILYESPLVSLLFLFMGTSTVIQQICKFKAHQYESAAKNSIWCYLETPYQWFYDFLLIQSFMNVYQVIGLLILGVSYSLKVRDVLKEGKKEETKRKKVEMAEELDDEVDGGIEGEIGGEVVTTVVAKEIGSDAVKGVNSVNDVVAVHVEGKIRKPKKGSVGGVARE
jgi:hypothetical protein